MDLTGITNKNEYYTNHYFATVFEENVSAVISKWNEEAKSAENGRTPWQLLRLNAGQYYKAFDRYSRSSMNMQTLNNIRQLADGYLNSLGYPAANPQTLEVDETLSVPVYLELTKSNGAPLLWILLSVSTDKDTGIMESNVYSANDVDEDASGAIYKGIINELPNEELATKILFGSNEPPRFLMFIGMNQIALIDRNKWSEKRYLQFELSDIFSRLENTTLQAMSVLLHKDSLCPDDGKILLDELDEESQKNASGVSQDLKYALRESIELLGNEILYDMAHRQGRDLEAEPVDAGELTLECLRYMYRMLFVLFIEARPELGYAPVKAQSYLSAYSFESLRDIADSIREDVAEVGNGYYLHETLSKLYELIYDGYPKTEEELKKAQTSESLHDMFLIAPLKAHIFDPEYTKMITNAKLRNKCMLRIIDLMSLTRSSGKRNERRGRISYANLGINQMGAVYEALLSYRGFIAEQDLYEVKRAGDSFNELDVGYFVPESELGQYTEDERVRYESGENKGKLRMYAKGSFIYRLAGREREKSASYYTPEVLTKCLVKYALKELLKDKTADEILQLTVCEPAMGSAAFLNEAINQLAEAYITRKEKETGTVISYDKRFNELQKVKMYIADRNVYGIDLNPVAVELAEVSLWLNTIYEGGFVPWFGTQLFNGNSLIGARRQCYRIENAQATSKGLRWYEMEPERLGFNDTRANKGVRLGRKQIYHFLLGDPGMCNYNDKIIKSLEPENIKKMTSWNKKFIEPISNDDAITLLRLSDTIDNLWNAQIELQKEIGAKTQDHLSIFGHEDTVEDSHTTIRQKDQIFKELYKSEHMKNAGPYARLKFAMDYWCSLWFWPIDKADLLPTRSEFLFDMSLILEGTVAAVNTTGNHDKNVFHSQTSLFPTEMEKMANDIVATYGTDTIVDIPALRRENPRLNLAGQIAEQNHFMHWELEFADIFKENGGFDLIIGNPPWIKMTWNEQNVLADTHPIFVVKKFTAAETTHLRNDALASDQTWMIYFREYESVSGQQSFLNAVQNYADLKGQQTNLYKCFLPQAWVFGSKAGVSAFVHPDGVYDDPKGGALRKKIYPKLRFRFHFSNEKKLFADIKDYITFSLNIYSNETTDGFDSICNLYLPSTIEQCYDDNGIGVVPGIKDQNGEWNTSGHHGRVVHIGKSELQLFAKLFDGSNKWEQARLPILHAQILVDVLKCFTKQKVFLGDIADEVYSAEMWHETNNQNDGTIVRDVHFPVNAIDMIYSGPHIGVANPVFKTSRRECKLNSDYDNVDLTSIPPHYFQRCNYTLACSVDDYVRRVPIMPNGKKHNSEYNLCMRKMLNQSGERTLIAAIIPRDTEHINGLFSLTFEKDLLSFSTSTASIPYDFFLKITGKANVNFSAVSGFPVIEKSCYQIDAIERYLLLTCLTDYYRELWGNEYRSQFKNATWTKSDPRLNNNKFSKLTSEWTPDIPLRTDYERRQALVEIDVLIAMSLGMSLDELTTIYRLQFPVMQQYEADTWYDTNGRIVFTNNRSLNNVGYRRDEWENNIKGAPAGKVFTRTITDDTMPVQTTGR
jgi:type I restriction-modification system DNA methylase subunit